MKILVTGSSGFIGQALCRYLNDKGHEVVAYSHTKKSQHCFNDSFCNISTDDEFPQVDAIVNLGGESIDRKRLTSSRIDSIISSRVNLVEMLKKKYKDCFPPIFVQASACGIYRDGENLKENSPLNDDIFASICKKVEASALSVKTVNPECQVILARIGVVVGEGGGIAEHLKFLPAIQFINGSNLVPYIRIEELTDAIAFSIEKKLSGAINMCSPDFLSLNDLLKLCNSKKCFLPAIYSPKFFLRLDKRFTLLLCNQELTPDVLIRNGFKFH
ncbi:MAG: NAD-dependent epimerase/dehydratase family protein [Succinivibrio sp.]